MEYYDYAIDIEVMCDNAVDQYTDRWRGLAKSLAAGNLPAIDSWETVEKATLQWISEVLYNTNTTENLPPDYVRARDAHTACVIGGIRNVIAVEMEQCTNCDFVQKWWGAAYIDCEACPHLADCRRRHHAVCQGLGTFLYPAPGCSKQETPQPDRSGSVNFL